MNFDSKMKTALWNVLVKARQNAVKAENEMMKKDGADVVTAHREAQRELGKWELSWFEFSNLLNINKNNHCPKSLKIIVCL